MAESYPAPTLASPSDAVSLLESAAVISAAGEPVRLALLRALAAQAPQSVAELAARVQRPADGVAKHLRVLHDARVITAVTPAGTDGRKQYYEIPALFRSRDTAGRNVLDFGIVALRLDTTPSNPPGAAPVAPATTS